MGARVRGLTLALAGAKASRRGASMDEVGGDGDSAICASFNKGQVCAGDPDVWRGRGDLLSLCWNGAIAGKEIHVVLVVVHGSGGHEEVRC